MKNVFLILIILLIGSCKEQINDVKIQDELYTFSGRVLDSYFNNGVPEVSLKIIPGNHCSVSDSLGYFIFENIPSGKYKLILECIYFLSDTIEVNIHEQNRDTFRVSLERETNHFYNFNFNVFEGYSGYETVEEPFIKISIATEVIFGCSNYQILTNNSISGNQINIVYERITIGNVCQTAEGPATTNIPMFVKNGNYQLILKQYDIVDKYFLIITDSSITVESLKDNLITKPKYKVYWRYPKNSFAIVGGATQQTLEIYNNFIKMINDSTKVNEIKLPNYGTLCYPTESQGHYIDLPSKYYVYERDEDFDKIGVILKNYSKNHIIPNSGLSIWIINWKNKKYYSWILDN